LPKDLPSEKHRALLPHAVGLGRHAETPPSRALVETREREGRAARPTAAIIDNRGPGPLKKGAALDSQGHDAGKDVTGRKRQILVSFPFIERSFPLWAWISRDLRSARDFGRFARAVVAFIRLAMIRIVLRRLITPCHSNVKSQLPGSVLKP
jgi:hypothetical protein